MRVKTDKLHKMLCTVSGGVNIYCNCYYITFIFFFCLGLYNLTVVDYHVFNIFSGKDRIVFF